jgi:hypothetical protein
MVRMMHHTRFPYRPPSKICAFLIANERAVAVEDGYDFVYISDGPTKASHTIAALTGQLEPKGHAPQHEYHSTGNALFLRFQSDRSVQSRGFVAAYVCTSALVEPAQEGACEVTEELHASPATQTLAFNGHDLGGRDQTAGADCSWLVTCAGRPVALWFDWVDTEPNFDFVYVYDGRSTDARNIAHLSGSHARSAQRYTSATGALLIRFEADGTVGSKGFTARYQCSSPASCGHLDACGVCGGDGSSCKVSWKPLVTAETAAADPQAAQSLPPARNATAVWVDAAHGAWVFGGQGRSGLLGDLWRFDGSFWTLEVITACTALRCAALRCAALRCAALRCAALRCAALRCAAPRPR